MSRSFSRQLLEKFSELVGEMDERFVALVRFEPLLVALLRAQRLHLHGALRVQDLRNQLYLLFRILALLRQRSLNLHEFFDSDTDLFE